MTERAPSLTDRAYSAIREAILTSRLMPGQLLTEAQIARELHMSKTPVREALQRLASEDLVVLDRFRGAAVRPVSPELMRNLYELRELLEPLAVRQAVPRLTEADLSQLEEAVAGAESALARGDIPTLGRANRTFHEVLIRRAANAYLERVLSRIQDQIGIASFVVWLAMEIRIREHREHVELLAAVRKGQAERASELMAAHLAAFQGDVIHALESRGDDAGRGLLAAGA